MVRIEYLEDQNGDLTKVLMSDKKFETMTLTNTNGGDDAFCVKLTQEMEAAFLKTLAEMPKEKREQLSFLTGEGFDGF